MRCLTLLVCVEIMAEAMQTDNFPYLPTGPAEVNKMIQEHGDLFLDTKCNVCSAALISESQKLTHYQSKKHANKVRRYLSLQNEKEDNVNVVKKPKTSDGDCNNGDTDRTKVCPLCNMTFTSPVMAESHYQGKIHAKRLKMQMAENPTPEAPQKVQPIEKPADKPSEVTEMDSEDPDRFCSKCKASFNNPMMAQQHYAGKKHKKRMTRLKLMETYGPATAPASTLSGYPCTICNIVLNSVEQYQSHITGARHKNQMKKSGVKTTEDQPPAVQSQNDEKQFTPAGDQDAPADNQYASGDDQYAPEDDQYAPEDDQYAPGDDQYALEDCQYGAEEGQFATNDQYAPEYTEFSEQFQYT